MKPPHDLTLAPLDTSVTIEELSEQSGLTRRTIRFYVLSGVVTGPQGQGPSARYPASHVPRLRLVRRWQDEGLQLAVITQRLSALSDLDVASALTSAGAPIPPRSPSAPATPQGHPSPGWPSTAPGEPDRSDSGSSSRGAFVRSPWERFELEPGVELHVRRPLTTSANRRVQRLLELAAALRASS